jgi:protease PrsW
MNTLLLILSLLPIFVILLYIYRKDKYQKEPLRLLLKCLLFGAIAAFAIMSLPIPNNFHTSSMIANSFLQAFLSAAIPEEFVKYLFLYILIWYNKNFDEYFDGIVYATFISLGFAGIENIMYVFSAEGFAQSLYVSFTRAIISVPAHFLFAVSMGYYFSLAKFNPSKRAKYLWLSFLTAVLLHGTFDFILFLTDELSISENTTLATLLSLAFYFFDFWLWKKGLKLIREHARLSSLQNDELMSQNNSEVDDNDFEINN